SFFLFTSRAPPSSPLFPYTTLFRSVAAATSLVFTLGLVCFVRPGFAQQPDSAGQRPDSSLPAEALKKLSIEQLMNLQVTSVSKRSEEHTSELQSRGHLVCRLLLEKK